MYKYKIVLNGQGGYFFCSLVKKEIVNYWLKEKSLELLQEYILSQYLEHDSIEDEWRIPDLYRFDIFNNINSLCMWESDSIEINDATICDIYSLGNNYEANVLFEKESDFSKQKLIESFLCSEKFTIHSNDYNWNTLVANTLIEKRFNSAFLIYFKVNARGYGTHDKILTIEKPICINKLKFYTGMFGSNESACYVIKKALYKVNTSKKKVLHDFRMLESAVEKNDFDFTGVQEVNINDIELKLKWIEN